MKVSKIKYFFLITVAVLSTFNVNSVLALVNNSFHTSLELVGGSVSNENDFVVNINISTGFKLKGLSANLIYDNGLIEIKNVDCHDKFSCTLGDNGEIVASSVRGVDGEYVLMTLVFKILDDNYKKSANDIAIRLGSVKGAYNTVSNSSMLTIFEAEKQEDETANNSDSDEATMPNTGLFTGGDFSDGMPLLLYLAIVICFFGLAAIVKKVIRKK